MYPIRGYKGIVELLFNFTFVPASNEVIKMRVTFPNQTSTIYNRSEIPQSLKYTLYPSGEEYSNQQIIQMTLYYDNFKSFDYIIPVLVVQPSYYSMFDGMVVEHAQFIDTSDNTDMLIVLKTNTGNVHNMILQANETSSPAITEGDTTLLGALSADLVTLNPIVDNFGNYIEVTPQP